MSSTKDERLTISSIALQWRQTVVAMYTLAEFTNYNGTPANHLVRLHPDGTVAQTFGDGFDQYVGLIALHATVAGTCIRSAVLHSLGVKGSFISLG